MPLRLLVTRLSLRLWSPPQHLRCSCLVATIAWVGQVRSKVLRSLTATSLLLTSKFSSRKLTFYNAILRTVEYIPTLGIRFLSSHVCHAYMHGGGHSTSGAMLALLSSPNWKMCVCPHIEAHLAGDLEGPGLCICFCCRCSVVIWRPHALCTNSSS